MLANLPEGRTPPAHRLTPERLTALRKVAGLSKYEMAEALDYSPQHYGFMESGKRRIPAALSLCVKSQVIGYLRKRVEDTQNRIEKLSTLA